jgi:hypothetical protein
VSASAATRSMTWHRRLDATVRPPLRTSLTKREILVKTSTMPWAMPSIALQIEVAFDRLHASQGNWMFVSVLLPPSASGMM